MKKIISAVRVASLLSTVMVEDCKAGLWQWLKMKFSNSRNSSEFSKIASPEPYNNFGKEKGDYIIMEEDSDIKYQLERNVTIEGKKIEKTEENIVYEWESKGTDSKRGSWIGEGKGVVTKDDDGSKTITSEYSKTLEDGTVITINKETDIYKDEDGIHWDREATITGPKDKTTTVTSSGNAQKTEDGVAWDIERYGKGPQGREWNSTTSGKGIKTEDGFKWNSDTYSSSSDGKVNWHRNSEGNVKKEDRTWTGERKGNIEVNRHRERPGSRERRRIHR